MAQLKLSDDPFDKPMTEEDIKDMRRHLKKLGVSLLILGGLSLISIVFRLIIISYFAVMLLIPIGILIFPIKKRYMFLVGAIGLIITGLAQFLGGVVIRDVPYILSNLTTYPGFIFLFFGGWAIKDFKDFS
jgi:hypothetical protein